MKPCDYVITDSRVGEKTFFRYVLLADVDISETVYPNDLKFDVRIVLYQVPFQNEFQIIRTNRFRDIELGSLPKKR